LTATNGSCTNTFWDTVRITPPACNLIAGFTHSGVTTAPANLTFTNQTTPDSATRYKWSFGTGDSSSLKNPAFTFKTAGKYIVGLTATNGSCTNSFLDTVTITAPACNLIARFTHSGVTTAPANLTFTNKTTPDSATRYKWNFGTRDTSSLKNPAFTFRTAGQYIVSLTATNGSCTSTFWDTITITAPACNITARFTYDGATVSPAAISFRNLTTSATSITNYKWYFGNGDSSSGINPIYTYVNPGIYKVKLIAYEGAVCRSETDQYIRILEKKCTVNPDFTYFTDSAQSNKINFINQGSLTTDSIKYYWKFGDGYRDSTTVSPTHVYWQTGNYYVCLQASNSNLCTKTICKTIPVKLPLGKIAATPNPVKSTLNFYLYVDIGSTYVIRFSNSAGFVAKEIHFLASPGANNLYINTSDLPNGFYYVTAESKYEKVHTQIFKL